MVKLLKKSPLILALLLVLSFSACSSMSKDKPEYEGCTSCEKKKTCSKAKNTVKSHGKCMKESCSAVKPCDGCMEKVVHSCKKAECVTKGNCNCSKK